MVENRKFEESVGGEFFEVKKVKRVDGWWFFCFFFPNFYLP